MMGFILFLTVFLGLYSSLHLYGLVRLKGALTLDVRANTVVLAFMIMMIIAPIVVRLLERNHLVLAARTLAYVAFAWMALLFIFCATALALDGYRIVVALVQKVSGADLAFLHITARQCFWAPLAIAVGVVIFGMLEARQVRIERVIIRTSKITPSNGAFRIAQISDVHLGLLAGEDQLARILARVSAARPDVLVSTGDLVDGRVEDVPALAKLLAAIPTRLGKYAVTGNHETYTGLQRAVEITEAMGLTVLRGESVTLADGLQIAGVDDPSSRSSNPAGDKTEIRLLSQLAPQPFTVLLKHRPWVNPGSRGRFDLQLSGHTHKGQIFPFSVVVKRFYPYLSGLIHLGQGSLLYVNRGSGTWGPPVRFLAPPEVTLIEIVPQQEG